MAEQSAETQFSTTNDLDIAIIGMSCRVPGSATPEAFWDNLRDGIESVSFFEDEELLASGIDPTLINQPDYVKAGAVLSNIEGFDAFFFDFNGREAEMLDPQHRIFLECAWEALERAGYNTRAMHDNAIGLYASVAGSSYLLNNLLPYLQQADGAMAYQAFMGNDKDFAPTRVSYKLNLKGPSINVGTGCSSSLAAVHLACQSLLNGECDMALAGGSAIPVPQVKGYLYQEGMIMSPDGHCRAFDAKAQGVVGGRGAGLIVLKRLADAIADGDAIAAVIKGSAINNDGAFKVGYTAPSVDGQAAVIAEALAIADIDPDTITYIEAHGTGTPLGDPIEVAALTKAFREQTDEKGFCAIGSVKTNFGHLDTAAGIAGLIKTVLALKHQQIPPSLHFETPNPQIDFANSPFYVNTQLSPWETGDTPRRAGVSSFGIGGANAHVVLEEAPTEALAELAADNSLPGKYCQRPHHLLLLSAKTNTALDTATQNLAAHLAQHPDLNLADVAYTLQVGRQRFAHRRMVVCETTAAGATLLKTLDPQRVMTQRQEAETQPVVFMFSGQGSQYPTMGKDLYDCEPVFRKWIDHCAELLLPQLGLDVRSLLYPSPDQSEAARENLKQTRLTQPALFVIEYALAQLWLAWGVKPQAMIGHSIGEYVAACLAGVFSLEDALALVAHRGRLMQDLPPGAMAAVPLSTQELEPLLEDDLNIAAINGPTLTVVSGTTEAVEALANQLAAKGVDVRHLHTSHGFHSPMMEPILPAFIQLVEKVKRRSPQIPYLSNVTGTWITPAQASDPTYWAHHIRQTVRFSDGLQQLFDDSAPILLEIGPGRTLSALARRHPQKTASQVVLSSLRHPQDQQSDTAFLLNTLGQLWMAGGQIDWPEFYAHERRYRLPLPTYPFERQRYWVDPPAQTSARPVGIMPPVLGKKPDIADWFYGPTWTRSLGPLSSSTGSTTQNCWLIFVDACNIGAQLAARLEQAGQDVVTVTVGSEFRDINPDPYARNARLQQDVEAWSEFREANPASYTLNPHSKQDYEALLKRLSDLGKWPNTVLHLWNLYRNTQASLEDRERFENAQTLGFYSLIYLAQALGRQDATTDVRLVAVSNNMQSVTGEESLCPEKATVLGALKSITQESPNIRCQSIDVILPALGGQDDRQTRRLIEQLWPELTADWGNDSVIAYRGKHRWVQTFEPIAWPKSVSLTPALRQNGVYLITGGLGNIGFTLAEYLAKTVQAKLILTGRSEFPDRAHWDTWLTTHAPEDPISGKIQILRRLEALGSEVFAVKADVADKAQMQAALTQAESRFGPIHGVFHGAGAAQATPLAEIGTAECEAQFHPKVYGLLVLKQLLRERQLDFCLVFSSIASVLGGSGFTAYAASNIFMDAFAEHQNQTSATPWISVNWDGWKFGESTQPISAAQAALADLAIAPEEGIQVIERILSVARLRQVVISTGDLQARIRQWVARQPNSEDLEGSYRSPNAEAISLHSRPNLANPYAAPRNPLEQTIAEIWQTLLGVEQVGIHDNFFELGGDSLLATQIVSRLRQACQIEISLRMFLESPTVAILGDRIETLDPTELDAQTAIEPIQIAPRDGHLPLSFSQQRLWFLAQLEPDSPAYNIPAAYRLKGTLQVSALEQSLRELVRRHESLRTAFPALDGQPTQVIHPDIALKLPLVDLQSLPPEQQEAIAQNQATAEAHQPFDLGQGPLLRVKLLRLGAEDHVLLLTMHHIVSDGWSLNIFFQELTSLYVAFSNGQASPLSKLPIQYADFAVWQRQQLQGDGLAAQLDYWKHQLGGKLPLLDLPTDHPRPPVQTYRGSYQFRAFPQALTEALNALSQQEGATLFMILLAAFQTLLHRYSGQDDIIVGSPISGRNRLETEGLIGFFINTLVLRTQLQSDLSFRELLTHVRERVLAAYTHQDLPFEKLVEALHPERNPSYSPIFQVMFILQNFSAPTLQLPGLSIHPVNFQGAIAKFDLTLFISESDAGLQVSLEYNTDLFEAAAIACMLENYQTLLESIIANPDQRLADLPLSIPTKSRQLANASSPLMPNPDQPSTSNHGVKSIDEFLSDLRRLGVKLWLDEDNLRFKAPKGAITPTLLDQLKERKPDILRFLRQADAAPQTAMAPIQPVSRQKALPISFAQQRLWFLHQLDSDSSVYNILAASLLKGVLNIGALEQSLQEILRRHECLRTTFPSIDGQPIQVIAPESSLTLPLIDLQHLPVDQRQTSALQQAAEIAQQPFDLANGPLIRATLLRLVAEEHMLIIVVHHIIFDGWSSTVFDQELAALYTAFSRGQPSPLADLPFQYADFAVWQRQWLQGEVLASQLNYWKQTLSGAPSALALPTDHPRPPIQTFRGAQEELELSETVAAALKALSQRQGATLFMTLLAAFQTLLHRYCRQDDIIVGSPIAGRHRLETEELIGLFMNTLAFRTHLGDDPSFRDLLARVREVVLGAYNHQDLPFEKLVEELQLPRDQSRTPLFQVMFALQNFSGQPPEFEGLTHEPAKVFNNTAKFDLTLTMGEMGQKLGGILEYNTDLFDGSTIKQLASNYQALLESILANPDQRLSEIPMLIPDKPQLLSDPAALSTADWNGDNPTENGMPSIDEFLSELRRLGVKLWLEGDSLRFKAARGSLNPTLLAQLKARKAEILTFLRQVRR